VIQRVFKTHRFRLFGGYSARLGDILVFFGFLSPQTLRQALRDQKITAQPLGQMLLARGVLTYYQLSAIPVLQKSVRVILAISVFCSGLIALGNGSARAAGAAESASDQNFPAALFIAAPVPETPTSHSVRHRLMGMAETASSDITAFTKWISVIEKFKTELQSSEGQANLAVWQKDFKSFKDMSIKDKIHAVNAQVNQKPYVSDQENWGQSDYWETPLEFMKRGGDCEGYAIAKYVALRALGVREDQLRLAIVQDTQKNVPHAVLIVYVQDEIYILDNQIQNLIDGRSAGRYRPIYSINAHAWWLHTPSLSPPDDGFMVASGN